MFYKKLYTVVAVQHIFSVSLIESLNNREQTAESSRGFSKSKSRLILRVALFFKSRWLLDLKRGLANL